MLVTTTSTKPTPPFAREAGFAFRRGSYFEFHLSSTGGCTVYYSLMTPTVAIWLAVSILFEVLGDIAVKKASLGSGILWWIGALVAYNLMLFAWFLAIAYAKEITVPGTIWLLAGQVALVAVGWGLFSEKLSGWQLVGTAFAGISLVLLSL